ncbi:MAG: MFS transporter [Proteobacteria bacterium]|nr:MFS transporter [Pseudomonadota bacterium]
MTKRPFIPRKLPRGVWLIAATSTVLMSGFGMIVPLIPVYGKQLGATAGELGFLMAGLFAGRLAAQIPAGIAADRLGRRPVLLGALIGYTLTCIGYALASSPLYLIAFRMLQGLSAGFFSVAARSLMSDLTGPRMRGTAQGIYSSSVNLGFVLGPVVGSLSAVHFSISTPFWASAVLSGAALVVLSLISYPKPTYTPVIVSPRPRVVATFMRDSRVRLLAGTNLLFMAGLSVIMTLFPVAGEAEIRGGLTFVGSAFTAAGISGLLFGPLAGRLSDRHGRPPLMMVGVLLAAAEGAVLFTTRSPWMVGMGFFLGGIGAAAFFNSLHAAVGDLTIRKERGTVTGMIGLAGECGGITGSLIAPVVWMHTDLRTPFALQIVFTAVAVFLVAWLWRLKTLRPTHYRAGVRESVLSG